MEEKICSRVQNVLNEAVADQNNHGQIFDVLELVGYAGVLIVQRGDESTSFGGLGFSVAQSNTSNGEYGPQGWR